MTTRACRCLHVGRLRVSVVAAVMLALLVIPAWPTATAANEPPKLVGLVTGERDDLFTLQSKTGRAPAFFQLFISLESPIPHSWDDWRRIESDLDRLGAALVLEVTTNDLAALNSGKRSAALADLVQVIRHWVDGGPDRRTIVIPLPEANIATHPWGGDPEGFKRGYRRIHDALRAAGLGPETTRFMFAVNGPSNASFGYAPYYPGDDVVDVVGFSRLNRNDPWLDYHESFGRFIEKLQQEVSVSKPIMAYQTGSVTESRDRGAWLDDMFAGLGSHDQVVGFIYFNRNKYEAGKQNDYRVVNGDWVDPRFAAGMRGWSDASEVQWIFDGSMDRWEADRAARFRFRDILDSSFRDEILWVADRGITEGCGEGLYCPRDPVTRAQMATFLARALTLPPANVDWFADDAGSVHEPSINRAAEAGITRGCDARAYCPNATVSRAQMASFLSRALDLPDAPRDYFLDDQGSTHERNINALAHAGITLGCSSDRYCPGDGVTREQMAAFLYRALTP